MKSRKKKTPHLIFIRTERILHTGIRPKRIVPYQDISRLCESIIQFGIINPITVRRHGQNFELVAGEKRLVAARLLNMDTVPCYLVDVPTRKAAFMALAENVFTPEKTVFETADGIEFLLEKYGATPDELAKVFGMKPSEISGKMRIAKLRPEEKIIASENSITEEELKALVGIKDRLSRALALTRIVEEKSGLDKAKETASVLSREFNTIFEERKRPIRKGAVKDMGFFENSLSKIVKGAEDMGISVETAKREEDGKFVYLITVNSAV